MSAFVCAASALSVAVLFYSWRSYHEMRMKKLRERVTYMLWVMANSVPDCQ
jgi:hypothetical protein